jgi:hypothetical protein
MNVRFAQRVSFQVDFLADRKRLAKKEFGNTRVLVLWRDWFSRAAGSSCRSLRSPIRLDGLQPIYNALRRWPVHFADFVNHRFVKALNLHGVHHRLMLFAGCRY